MNLGASSTRVALLRRVLWEEVGLRRLGGWSRRGHSSKQFQVGTWVYADNTQAGWGDLDQVVACMGAVG